MRSRGREIARPRVEGPTSLATLVIWRSRPVLGPTLPSAASAGHGSYLGISCRDQRSCTTVEDDPIRTFAPALSSTRQSNNFFDPCGLCMASTVLPEARERAPHVHSLITLSLI